MKSIFSRVLLAVLACALVASCGVTFAPVDVNDPLPDSLTNMSVYPGGVAGYDFQDLVGNILLVKTSPQPTDNPLRVGVVRPKGYDDAVIPITDPNNYYRSRIQKGADAQGSYLAFAANFSDDDMAELTLSDVARAGITITDSATWTDVQAQLIAWVAANPKTDASTERLWIKSALLTRRIYSSETKITASASDQAGEVVGVKSGIYRKDEKEIRSVIIGFDAFDVDVYVASMHKVNANIVTDPNKLLEAARVKGVIRGTISKN